MSFLKLLVWRHEVPNIAVTWKNHKLSKLVLIYPVETMCSDTVVTLSKLAPYSIITVASTSFIRFIDTPSGNLTYTL